MLARLALFLLVLLSAAACGEAGPSRMPAPGGGLAARVTILRPGELWTPDPQDLRPLLEARGR